MTPLYAIVRLRDLIQRQSDSSYARDVLQHMVIELDEMEWKALRENLGPFMPSVQDMDILREVSIYGVRVRRKEMEPQTDWLDQY